MKEEIITSPYDNFCGGYGNPGNTGRGYLLGTVLGVGKVKVSETAGSDLLEKIEAFDLAEIEGTYLGQINMITVSSFCGPEGKIWGYDVARPQQVFVPIGEIDQHSKVFSLSPLLLATRELFGTVDKRLFPLMPGEHVPCANKSLAMKGPGRLYCSLSLGIAAEREKDACVLMEDVGIVRSDDTKEGLIKKSVRSVLNIGKNQRVRYNEIFTEVRMLEISGDEIGCVLVAAPYFSLAKKAISLL